MLAWVLFVVVQLISLVAMVLGWFLLIPFCLAQAWKPAISTMDPTRAIDVWQWGPLNLMFGNPEDGVSGARALIWRNGARVPYMPNSWAPWRAYLWSAWRNSCDNLKYVFAWKGGPFVRKEWIQTLPELSRRWPFVQFMKMPMYAQAGYYPSGLPVLSAGRM